MSAPAATVTRLDAPKAGHTSDEYEDAAAVRAADWPIRAAVADGATESAFARVWAEHLADGMTALDVCSADALNDALNDALSGWRVQWQSQVAARSSSLPWYAAAKADEGAFATVLACTFHANGRWTALSIGDCVLFHLRDGACRQAWPLDDPDAFDNRPALLSSHPEAPVPPVETQAGTWQPNDVFLLATDAVAAWLLRTDPVRALDLRPDAFPDAVHDARSNGTLRNDDATLLRIRLPQTAASS